MSSEGKRLSFSAASTPRPPTASAPPSSTPRKPIKVRGRRRIRKSTMKPEERNVHLIKISRNVTGKDKKLSENEATKYGLTQDEKMRSKVMEDVNKFVSMNKGKGSVTPFDIKNFGQTKSARNKVSRAQLKTAINDVKQKASQGDESVDNEVMAAMMKLEPMLETKLSQKDRNEIRDEISLANSIHEVDGRDLTPYSQEALNVGLNKLGLDTGALQEAIPVPDDRLLDFNDAKTPEIKEEGLREAGAGETPPSNQPTRLISPEVNNISEQSVSKPGGKQDQKIDAPTPPPNAPPSSGVHPPIIQPLSDFRFQKSSSKPCSFDW